MWPNDLAAVAPVLRHGPRPGPLATETNEISEEDNLAEIRAFLIKFGRAYA